MIVSLIAAVAEDGAIGKLDGGLPWHLPRDIQHFRNYTDGKWMLLGRKTYQEMSGFFTDRTPIVITSSPNEIQVENGYAVNSIDAGVELAKERDVEELVISGGSEIYHLGLPLVSRMILTRVSVKIDSPSVYFPQFSKRDWLLHSCVDWPADDENQFAIRIETWDRNDS